MTTPLSWLLPTEKALPSVLRLTQLGAAEWHALLQDGVLRHVWGDVAAPADLPSGPEERGEALRPHIPGRAVVGRMAAAWVHTGLVPPVAIDLLVPPGRRRLAPHPHRRTHEAELPDSDVVSLGGIRLTSAARTGIDLARWELGRGAPAIEMLDALVALGFDPAAALRQLDDLGGQRGLRAARSHLRLMVDAGPAAAPAPAGRSERRGTSGADRGLLGGPGTGDPVDVEDALDLPHSGEHRGEVGRLGHLEHEPRERHAVT